MAPTRRTDASALVPDYCKTTSPDNPQIEVVSELLNQVQCMYQNVLRTHQPQPGTSEVTVVREDVSPYVKEIQALEDDKACLEEELGRLQNEMDKLLGELDGEAERREELEDLVDATKKQINDLDRDYQFMAASKEILVKQLEDLNTRLQQALENCERLQAENDELIRKCSRFDGNLQKSNCFKSDLQRALADCCAQVDKLTDQIGNLQGDLSVLGREKDDLQKERNDLARQLESLKHKYDTMKNVNDQLIKKLKDEVRCLEAQQKSSCDKFKQAIAAHHAELKNMTKKLEKMESNYKAEKEDKADLEKRLRDCEQKNRGNPRNKDPDDDGKASAAASKSKTGGEDPDEEKKPGCGDDDGKGSNDGSGGGGGTTCTSKYKDEIEILEERKKKLERQVYTLTIQNTQLTSGLASLQEKVLDLERYRSAVDENNNEIYKEKEESVQKTRELEILMKDKDIQISLLTKSLQEIQERLNKQKETLKNNKEVEALREQLKKLENEKKSNTFNARSRSSSLVRQDKPQDTQRLQSNLSQLRVKNTSLTEDLKEMKNQIETTTKSHEKEVKHLKRLVNSRDKDINKLQSTIEEKVEEIKEKDAALNKEKEELSKKKKKLEEERKALELEIQRYQGLSQGVEQEKLKLQDFTKQKEKLVSELNLLKEQIKGKIGQGRPHQGQGSHYELQLKELQDKFDAQLEMNRQLAEINEQLGNQFRHRELVNEIRESNEELLRKELQSVIATSKKDVDQLKRIIDEREEELAGLKIVINRLRQKYALANKKNEELVKKVERLSSMSLRDEEEAAGSDGDDEEEEENGNAEGPGNE